MPIIQVINPNTSLIITKIIGKTAHQVAAPNTKILISCPEYGVPSIESNFDEVIAAVGVLELIKRKKDKNINGYIIACFGDPGLLAARELVKEPVIGIAEAAMHTATLVATRFSIVTTLPRTLMMTRTLLQKYGFKDHCAALHTIDLPVLSLENADNSGLAQEKIRQSCIKSKCQDGSGAIILGCGGMASLARDLTKELGMPIIDGVSAAVKIVEALINLGIGTSKHGDLDFPLKKTITGTFQFLN